MIHSPLPFELRLLMRPGLSGLGMGTLCAGLPLLLCLVLLHLTGESLLTLPPAGGVRLTGQAHVAVLVSLLLGYLAGVCVHFARSGGGRPRDGLHDREPGSAAGPTSVVENAVSLLAGASGVLLGLVFILLSARAIRLQEPERDVLGAGELAIDVFSLLLLWGIGRAAAFTLRADRMAKLRPPRIDLFNLAPLFVIGRTGLRPALAWIGGISLCAAIMAFDPNPGVLDEAGWIMLLLLCMSLAVGSFALLAPLWHLQDHIRAVREQATGAILQELRILRDGGSARPGEEADLLARLAYLSGVSTWPMDLGTLRRFGFYVFFPVASWLFGNVTQRLLDTLLVSELVRMLLEIPG